MSFIQAQLGGGLGGGRTARQTLVISGDGRSFSDRSTAPVGLDSTAASASESQVGYRAPPQFGPTGGRGPPLSTRTAAAVGMQSDYHTVVISSPQRAVRTEASETSVLAGDVKVEVAFGVTPRVKETERGGDPVCPRLENTQDFMTD